MGRKQSWSSGILIISVPQLRGLVIFVFNNVRGKKKFMSSVMRVN